MEGILGRHIKGLTAPSYANFCFLHGCWKHKGTKNTCNVMPVINIGVEIKLIWTYSNTTIACLRWMTFECCLLVLQSIFLRLKALSMWITLFYFRVTGKGLFWQSKSIILIIWGVNACGYMHNNTLQITHYLDKSTTLDLENNYFSLQVFEWLLQIHVQI